jgi:hypothetical protein
VEEVVEEEVVVVVEGGDVQSMELTIIAIKRVYVILITIVTLFQIKLAL